MPSEIIPQAKKVSDALLETIAYAKRKDESMDRRLFEFEMMRQFGASTRTVNEVLYKFESARYIDLDDEYIYPVDEPKEKEE